MRRDVRQRGPVQFPQHAGHPCVVALQYDGSAPHGGVDPGGAESRLPGGVGLPTDDLPADALPADDLPADADAYAVDSQ
ncbi:hypothetical protein G3I66_17675 [Streptomyces rubrogriseus]|uniref:Uncharacterized protein n=1 Tax=Streptomyces rubrogriseus TaxID=194673 RepID=A0A6G3TE34_9ACTN|nr:hypothetical protein [Streptomyces rubrogriseus]